MAMMLHVVFVKYRKQAASFTVNIHMIIIENAENGHTLHIFINYIMKAKKNQNWFLHTPTQIPTHLIFFHIFQNSKIKEIGSQTLQIWSKR